MTAAKARVVIGLPHLDALVELRAPTIEAYCRAAAEYEYLDDSAAYEAGCVQ